MFLTSLKYSLIPAAIVLTLAIAGDSAENAIAQSDSESIDSESASPASTDAPIELPATSNDSIEQLKFERNELEMKLFNAKINIEHRAQKIKEGENKLTKVTNSDDDKEKLELGQKGLVDLSRELHTFHQIQDQTKKELKENANQLNIATKQSKTQDPIADKGVTANQNQASQLSDQKFDERAPQKLADDQEAANITLSNNQKDKIESDPSSLPLTPLPPGFAKANAFNGQGYLQVVNSLQNELMLTGDKVEKERIVEEIKSVLADHFDFVVNKNEQKLRRLSERVENLRAELDRRRQTKNQSINYLAGLIAQQSSITSRATVESKNQSAGFKFELEKLRQQFAPQNSEPTPAQPIAGNSSTAGNGILKAGPPIVVTVSRELEEHLNQDEVDESVKLLKSTFYDEPLKAIDVFLFATAVVSYVGEKIEFGEQVPTDLVEVMIAVIDRTLEPGIARPQLLFLKAKLQYVIGNLDGAIKTQFEAARQPQDGNEQRRFFLDMLLEQKQRSLQSQDINTEESTAPQNDSNPTDGSTSAIGSRPALDSISLIDLIEMLNIPIKNLCQESIIG